MALMDMQAYENISNSFENNKYSIGIFFKIDKAFDTVCNILIQKLTTYGIRGIQFDWLKKYLMYVCITELVQRALSNSQRCSGMAAYILTIVPNVSL